MNLLDDLLATLPRDPAPVRQVLVGAHWTVVCSRTAGMAATQMASRPHGHSRVREVGHLLEHSAQTLAGWSRSENPLEASIGVAALNSLLEVDESCAHEINAADVLAQRGRDCNVALVGRFPFVESLRSAVGKLWVLELEPIEGEYPAEAAADLLPNAHVVAITGSTLMNHTLDGLLALCSPQSTVMVLGPSTPLSSVLFAHGAHILSGVSVWDEQAVLRTVGQGAGFRQLEGIRLVTLVRQAGA